MEEYPIVSVVMTTHNRTRVACETIDSLCRNLKYAGELRWIISDDRSENGHVQALIDQFLKYDIVPICKFTNDNHYSLGAALNNGLLEAFRASDVCLTTEDDWILQRELDITRHVEKIVSDESIAIIRMASILSSHTKEAEDGYLLVYGSEADKKISVFNNQVALRHRRVYKQLGYYYPNISPDDCECAYRNRFNEYTDFGTKNLRVLFPSDIPLHTLDDPDMYFIHCGVSTIGHTKYLVPARYEHFYSDTQINICFVMDNNYTEQILAIIQNIKETTTCQKTIYVLAWDVSGENKTMIENLSNNLCRVVVKTVLPYYIKQCMDAGGYERDKKRYTVPPTGLLKFCIPDILKDIDKVLYIDGDMTIHSSLEELFNIDVSGFYCAAVPDIGSITMVGRPLCKIMQGDKNYFNSGMMLMNLVRLRKDKMMGKLFKIKKGLTDRSLMDQDALNVGFKGHVKLLPCRYNYLHGITTSLKNKALTLEQINGLYGTKYKYLEQLQDPENILIYHYAGWTKPWRPRQEEWERRLTRAKIVDVDRTAPLKTAVDKEEAPQPEKNDQPSPPAKPIGLPNKVSFMDSATGKHDAVFVLGDGSMYRDLELMLAVKSMRKFCPFVDRIFIVGNKPRCSLVGLNCKCIQCKDPYVGSKDSNMMFKVIHAIDNIPDLSENFLLCSDDQLVTQFCSWDDFKPKYVRRMMPADIQEMKQQSARNSWARHLVKTLELANETKGKAWFYEPHIWSPVNKESFREMVKSIGGLKNAGVIKSQYYNYIDNLDHERIHDHKFFDSDSLNWSKTFKKPPKFISYNDKAFTSDEFRNQLIMLVK